MRSSRRLPVSLPFLGAPLTIWALCTLALVFTADVSCIADGSDPTSTKTPPPAATSLGPGGDLQISKKDHCPVCGMFPARIPQCAAGLSLHDGRTYYFCSNRCLLMAWRRPENVFGPGSKIQRMVVLDYFSGRPIDGSTAWWIAGSDVVGPMGPALVTFQSSRDGDAFRRRHGGDVPFKLDQLDAALWEKILSPDS
jgi:nitrous oxide reductase accessory protein NosL